MNKFAALLLPAAALIAAPLAAQSQTSKPVAPAAAPAAPSAPTPGPGFKIDDLGCTVRVSYFKNLSLSRANAADVDATQKAQARNSAIGADLALNYYLGRLTLAANDPYRGRRGEAIFASIKTATPQQNMAETRLCMDNAFAEGLRMMDTLKSK